MNQLYFTSHRRKSTRTVRLEYGKLGKMFVLKIYEGATNCKTTREDLPKEIFSLPFVFIKLLKFKICRENSLKKKC